MTKGELRAARKAAKAAGRPWNIETGENGHLEIVHERTPAEERVHARRMERWINKNWDAWESGRI